MIVTPEEAETLTVKSQPTTGKPLHSRIGAVLGDIQIAHTVFALPFALLSAHLAFLKIGGYKLNILIAILICMITARTAAMSFNRYLDRKSDSINPRTQYRAIPSGRARPIDALAVVIFCSILFIATCWYLGLLPFVLSFPTLIVLLGYSYAKRFTSFTHIWLGSALAIAPTGAWIAVTGTWSWLPVILSFAVVFWVAGFDIVYSLQDIDFDRTNRIFSLPAIFGGVKALLIARMFHLLSFGLLLIFGVLARIGLPYFISLSLVAILLVVEHSLVKPNDFSKVGIAFFTLNGIISIVLYVSALISSGIGTLKFP